MPPSQSCSSCSESSKKLVLYMWVQPPFRMRSECLKWRFALLFHAAATGVKGRSAEEAEQEVPGHNERSHSSFYFSEFVICHCLHRYAHENVTSFRFTCA